MDMLDGGCPRTDHLQTSRVYEVAMNLTEQVVLITGGSRGLGRAFAQALVAAGARVAITARGASELH